MVQLYAMTPDYTKMRCPTCGNYKTRPVAIDAIIIKDRKLLLVKRGENPGKGLWAFPGGHVDFNETLEETVRREVKEETGLTAKNIRFFGIYDDPKRQERQPIAIIYSADGEGKVQAGDDADDCEYFPLDQLPLPLAFDHEKILADFLRSITENDA